jgi:hypothetical protein
MQYQKFFPGVIPPDPRLKGEGRGMGRGGRGGERYGGVEEGEREGEREGGERDRDGVSTLP